MLKVNYYRALLLIGILLHLYISSIGFSNNISDIHGFRQTHTAISTFYLVKDGLTLNYKTPSLGAPWEIPIEFPTYQLIVASLTKLTGIGLIPIGRLVSLFFFYLGLFYLFKVLRILKFSERTTIISLLFILCSPLYLFWSRTFLIESTVLCLTIMYIYYVLYTIPKLQLKDIVLTLFFATLGSLTKPPTFTLGVIVLFWILLFVKKRSVRDKLGDIIFYIATLLFALGTNIVWLRHTNNLKALNPLAVNDMLNDNGVYWFFGDLAQRMRMETWDPIINRTSNEVAFMLPLIILIIVLGILFTTNRTYILALCITYLLGPLIFTNVYYIHNYYLYENGIYLLLAIGLSIAGLLKKNSARRIIDIAVVPLLLLLMLNNYHSAYYRDQLLEKTTLSQTGQVIKDHTRETDVVLMYVYDWNPEITFYAERKAIMDAKSRSLSDEAIKKSIQLTGKENITAMFTAIRDPAFVDERLEYFGLNKVPVYENQIGVLYTKF